MANDPIETVLYECFRSFAVLPGAERIDFDSHAGVVTGIQLNFFNGIAPLHAIDDDLRGFVDTAMAPFVARRAPFRWWVTESAQKAGVVETLRGRGLTHTFDSLGMAADLTSMRLDVPLPAGLTIQRIANVQEMRPWADVLIEGFERSPEEADIWMQTFDAIGIGERSQWTHFVGFLDGTPAAMTSVMTSGDLTGVYHVVTVPSARGRGCASALVLESLRHARERGSRTAVLQSSEMAENVYRSLGFVDGQRLVLYSWRP